MSARPKPGWHIGPMSAAHLAQVLAIEVRAYEHPWTEGILRDCLKASYSAWVMTDEFGNVVGYAFMSMAVGEAHLLNLCVDPDCQHAGLGRQLLEHLLQIARAAHNTIVLLEVRRSNKVALHLYESAGFERIGLRKAYYPARQGREDAFVLGFEIA